MRYSTTVLAAAAATAVVATTGNYALGTSLHHGGSVVRQVNEDRPPLPRWMKRPCAQEDSVNCYWNAATMGNGVGHSFYVRRMPGDVTGLVCVFYVSHRFAADHDHCAPKGR